MIKFPSIEQFRNVLREVRRRAEFVGLDEKGEPIMNRSVVLPKITFEAVCKLHGCCSSVEITKDAITFHSREREISTEKDNYGFARFASERQDSFKEFVSVNNLDKFNKVVIYGEWAGQGIQNKVAINNLPKSFFIFAIRALSETQEDGGWIDITNLNFSVFDFERIYNIRRFYLREIEIDFENTGDSINKLNEWMMEIEKECPVAAKFGHIGVGEGLVISPKNNYDSKLLAKIKGKEHSASHVKTLATVDCEKLASISAFVSKHCNQERLSQGIEFLKMNQFELTEKSTGHFIKFVNGDILKEQKDEMDANGFSMKDLGGPLSTFARRWFFQTIQELENQK